MRDLILGYVFIFAAVFTFIGSIYARRRKLEKKKKDLKEELIEGTRR